MILDRLGKELLFFAGQNLCDQLEGVIIGVDTEKPEYSHGPQHTEGYGSRGEEYRKKIRKEREQVHDSGKGKHVFSNSVCRAHLGIKVFCRPESQNIIDKKCGYSDPFYKEKNGFVLCADIIIGKHYADGQIYYNEKNINEIIQMTDKIRTRPDIYDFRD